MKRRTRGREFKSLLLHISVFRFLEMSENRSKLARVRAICAHARTQRIAASARTAQIWRNLSGRDLPRSADHRRTFASREREHAEGPDRSQGKKARRRLISRGEGVSKLKIMPQEVITSPHRQLPHRDRIGVRSRACVIRDADSTEPL